MWKNIVGLGRPQITVWIINPLNAKLNPICHLLALLGAHHILHVSGYKHTLIICNSYCFSTATMVARTRLNDTTDVCYLSC